MYLGGTMSAQITIMRRHCPCGCTVAEVAERLLATPANIDGKCIRCGTLTSNWLEGNPIMSELTVEALITERDALRGINARQHTRIHDLETELADKRTDLTSKSVEALATSEPSSGDLVAHPKHYNAHPSGVECIDIVQHHSFNVGSAIKYLWRAGLKSSEPVLRDLQKARQYIEFEIQKVQTE